MGAGAGGYVTIQLLTFNNTFDAGTKRLSRTSRLVFTPAETPSRDPKSQNYRPIPTLPDPGPTPGNPPAGKVALGGLLQTQVTKFNLYAYTDKALTNLVGMGTSADENIGKEAHEAFIGPLLFYQKPLYAGFAVALGPSGGRFGLIAEVEFEPQWPSNAKADKPLQLIPVVVAFGTDSFAKHYLLSVIVAQKTLDLVDAGVTQPYQ